MDEGSCIDIDECSYSPCDNVCINEPGGYRCVCQDGYFLNPDGTSCNGTIEQLIDYAIYFNCLFYFIF